jgi:hypothetical protein
VVDNERSRCIVHVIWFFYEIHFAISKILNMLHNFIIFHDFCLSWTRAKSLVHDELSMFEFFKRIMFTIIWLKLLITPMHKLWNVIVASNMKYMLLLDMSTKNFKLYVNSLHIYMKIKFHHHFNHILLCYPYTPLHKPLQNCCILLKFKCGLETNGFDLS